MYCLLVKALACLTFKHNTHHHPPTKVSAKSKKGNLNRSSSLPVVSLKAQKGNFKPHSLNKRYYPKLQVLWTSQHIPVSDTS